VTNERAQAWLASLGFKTEPEPAWIPSGEKPDFFVSGPTDAWVEVKTLEWDDSLGSALQDLKVRCEKLEQVGAGSIHAIVGPYDSRAARQALHHARKVSLLPTGDATRVVMIPGDPAYGADVELEYQAETGESVVQTGPASVSGQYQCYPALDPKNWSSVVTIRRSNGDTDTAKLYQRLGSRVPFQLALRIFASEKSLFVGSAGSGVRTNTSQKRIREDINKANSQIRNAQKARLAPGVVSIYHDSLDALGLEMFLAALFGDLSIPVTPVRGGPPKFGTPEFGPHAVLTGGKNRGVAIVRYYPYKDEPYTVVNPYADTPIDWRPFADAAWIMNEAGQFVLTGK
jgi:hypothetical protein